MTKQKNKTSKKNLLTITPKIERLIMVVLLLFCIFGTVVLFQRTEDKSTTVEIAEPIETVERTSE